MIKPKTLLLSLLFLPYLIWVVAARFMGIPLDSFLNTLVASFSIVYAIGIAFWGVPYTVMVIGTLVWSRNKSEKEVYMALSRSPRLLAVITAICFFLVYWYLVLTSEIRFSPIEDLFNLVWYSLLAMLGIFIYGYVFVFLSKGIYKVFEHFKLIKSEDVSLQSESILSQKSPSSDITNSENQ